jgi:hypothetical protein
VLLSHQLIQAPRAHPHGQGSIGSYRFGWTFLVASEQTIGHAPSMTGGQVGAVSGSFQLSRDV